MTAIPLAMTMTEGKTTGARPRAVASPSAAARFIRTASGLALFDDEGRFVGIVEAPRRMPTFGAAGDTLLVQRGA